MSTEETEPQGSQFVAPEGAQPEPGTLEHPEGEPAITEEDAAERADDGEPESQPIEGDDDDEGDGQGQGEPEGEPVEPGVAEARLIGERERKARDKALDKERERHAANLGRILGDEATHLVPCPVCIEAFDGWLFDPSYQQISTEMQVRMRQILGIDSWEDTPQASWARTCDTCNGHGEVRTGSKKEGRETTSCLDCNGAGWHNLHDRQQGNGHAEAPPPTTTGPTVYGADDPDPRVASLRADGYYVAAPVKIPTGA